MKWRPISESNRKPKKGVLRLYTFAPAPENRFYIEATQRTYDTDRSIGRRDADGFMDVPEFGVFQNTLSKPAPYDMEKDLERLRASLCPC